MSSIRPLARSAAMLLFCCGSVRAQAMLPASTCDVDAGATACMTLFPIPDFPAVSGTIALLPVHSPFGVAVTVDGRVRYRLSATIAGLPAPKSLGPYTVYIAWAYTIALDSAVKLGVVGNGRIDLGELDYTQFRILISAERSSAVATRAGRLMLRGTSPSARLMAHRDLMQPSAPGALRDPAHDTTGGMAGMHGAGWSMPPMSTVMPGMSALVPSVMPFRAGAEMDSSKSSVARPREIIHLKNGDTLALEAGLVRRTIAGRTFTMYAFNGQYPGPLIDVKQGTSIVVRFRNAIDQPTAVHWHGVRLDNRFDGAVGVTQSAVPRGGTFTYTLRFPDAGIYWYHPHVREDIQQDLGLYGNMLVRPLAAAYYSAVDREETLMLDDLLLDDSGPVPYGAESPTHALMGRFGNVMLVNGEPRYALDVKCGDIVRFYLTNASSARIFNISFTGARVKVIASDMGKFEREEWVESVVLAPAERYIVEVAFARSGRVPLVNRVQALDHMVGRYSPEIDTLGFVRVAATRSGAAHASQFQTLRRNGDVAAAIAPFRKSFDRPPNHSLLLTLRTHDLPLAVANMLIGINAPMEWNDGMPMMNWLATGQEVTWVLRDVATGKENMDIDWRFKQGDAVKLRIFNDPSSSHAMDHPIHLHGQRFLVLARDGMPATNLAWKDTAIIPAGETVDLLVDMSNPGRWMVHCHVAEHLGAGMMAVFTVEPSAGRRR
ncbi:MAG: multicopper oxidase family protein [Gemmatimonadota bacterium]|nr:multicopper oxidase family protein [Gemmatimonadota bacterium]